MSTNFATDIKSTLDNCIIDMAKTPHLFAKNPGHDFIRNRKLGFSTLIAFLIGIKGGTISSELENYFSEEEVMTSSAFIQQRSKLNDKAFPHLLLEFNKRCSSYDTNKYKGFRLLAIDGSDFNIAYDENSDTFMTGQKSIGYNQLHLNAIYDVLNYTFTNIYIQPKPKYDERKACLAMINEITFTEPTLLLADRGYESYQLFATAENTPNLEYLIRVKNKGLKPISVLPMEEFDKDITIEIRTTQTKEDKEAYRTGRAVWIAGPSKFGKEKKHISWTLPAPYKLSFRVVRFEISHGVYETIVTSLNRFDFPIKEIKKMYHKRWKIETSFRWLKYAVGSVNFHGKSKEFSIQEIYAHIIMYNFSMRVMMNVEIIQKGSWKYIYQINFTKGFGYCIGYWRYRGSSPPNLIKQIQKHILPIREGRQDKRKLKPKTFVPYIYRVAA